MKIAIFGGSFNPVHLGHLYTAEMVLKKQLVQEIWFVPCYKHAFKPEQELAPYWHRMEMVKLAIKGKKRIRVSAIEKQFKIKFTLDLLKRLRENFPGQEFFLVIGSELAEEFLEWKNPEEIIKLVKIIVVEKPNKKTIENKLINKKNCVFLKAKKLFDFSAKTIRENIARGESVEEMLPKKVKEYIEEKGLYKKACVVNHGWKEKGQNT